MNKKLTNTKGFPLVMMIFAFLFSAFGAAQEFIMHFVYEKTFKSDNLVDYVLLNNKGYFDVYGTAVFMFVFTFLIMFVLIGGVGKKTTGTKEGVFLVLTGVSAAVTPVAKTILFLLDGKLSDTKSDGELFRVVNELVCYALPAFISFLVILSGLGILIKAGISKTTVEVFRNKDLVKPVNPVVTPQTVAAAAPVVEAEPVMEEVKPVIEKPSDVTVMAEPVMEEVAPVVEEIAPVVEQSPKANVCVACGLEIAEGTKFCRHCGAKQE